MEELSVTSILRINSKAEKLFKTEIHDKFKRDSFSLIDTYKDKKKSNHNEEIKKEHTEQLTWCKLRRRVYYFSYFLIPLNSKDSIISRTEKLSRSKKIQRVNILSGLGIDKTSPDLIEKISNKLYKCYYLLQDDIMTKNSFREEIVLHQVYGLKELLSKEVFEEIVELDEDILNFHLQNHYIFGEKI